MTVGHLFTEGTADSNQVWLEVIATQDGEIIGNSGLIDLREGRLDPLAHFVNAYVLDREGNRIDRRNAEDIFTKLYDHQIPPGSSDTIHYRLEVPEPVKGAISVTAKLKYRKFDTKYLKAFQGEEFTKNDLPIVTISEDSVEFSSKKIPTSERSWQRWNDYGIGMFRKGAYRQAELAFQKVRELGRPEGPLNLSRLYIKEGRLEEAALFLNEAAQKGAYPWSVAWFSALVDMQNGEFDGAIEGLLTLVRTQFNDARQRGFDFSLDYRLQNQLAQAYFEKSKMEIRNEIWRDKAEAHYMAALALDPENVVAHYGLSQLYALGGRNDLATKHRDLHKDYRVDDNARDLAITKARQKDPAANYAAESIVIYDMHRR